MKHILSSTLLLTLSLTCTAAAQAPVPQWMQKQSESLVTLNEQDVRLFKQCIENFKKITDVASAEPFLADVTKLIEHREYIAQSIIISKENPQRANAIAKRFRPEMMHEAVQVRAQFKELEAKNFLGSEKLRQACSELGLPAIPDEATRIAARNKVHGVLVKEIKLKDEFATILKNITDEASAKAAIALIEAKNAEITNSTSSLTGVDSTYFTPADFEYMRRPHAENWQRIRTSILAEGDRIQAANFYGVSELGVVLKGFLRQ